MPHSDKHVPDNFHALYDSGFRASRNVMAKGPIAQTEGHKKIAKEVPDLQVSYDEATQVPNRVVSLNPKTRLSRAQGETPEFAVAKFIQEHSDIWNLEPGDAGSVKVVSVSQKGLKRVRMIQQIEGKEVFNSDLVAAVSSQNEVISVTGQIFAGATAAREQARAANATSEVAAIAKAASDLTTTTLLADSFAPIEVQGEQGAYRYYQFKAAGGNGPLLERPVRLKDVMFPLSEGRFVPGYYMELWIKDFPAFSYVMDSEGEPDILFRKKLTSDAVFKYRVHNTGDAISRPEDGPAPGTPHPTGAPNGFQAATIPEKLVQIDSLLQGRPWLSQGATTTSGNNCIAYADLSAPNGFGQGDVMGKISAAGTFDYVYNHNRPASDPTNLQNSLVGMFFHVNWLHDRWYEAGFDEASGNAQVDNFGLGGIGGDPILAEGNDFSGTDNANMSTPADGASPRMQMYEFVGPGAISRTSNHEALITFHEMGHYITNRLVGNASGLSNTQGRAMGEGWGDFFAISMTSQDGDDFSSGVFAVGGWTDVTPNFDDNYYFSIRRYPYTADMSKNPLTFKHISNSTVLPAGPPRNPNAAGPNNEVHNAGEVWCAILWECFVNLVEKHGHAEGERRMLEYVIGGLKQTPPSPTFTSARDGIITAVTAIEPGDLPAMWAGFAKRGMGANAVSPPSSSTSLSGVVEDFGVPPLT